MNQIFSHPGQPQMQVEVILASRCLSQETRQDPLRETPPPIYTIRMRYPRIIHAEVMTHRVFSRNARSSRAVPVKTMLNEIRNTPFVPWHWGANQKGMQASEECNASVKDWWMPGNNTVDNVNAWCQAATQAVAAAESFMDAGYHKQIVNRLIEPFSWIDTLVTSTEWNNFLWLRDHMAAEPHLQDLASLVREAIIGATMQVLEPGEWHLPYVTVDEEHDSMDFVIDNNLKGADFLCRISAARCARISYKPFDGDTSYEKELERYDSLVSSDRVHASPLEHQAKPDLWIKGHEGPYGEWRVDRWSQSHLHGNLVGWMQYRKTVPGENHH